jgi:hypothetical protein
LTLLFGFGFVASATAAEQECAEVDTEAISEFIADIFSRKCSDDGRALGESIRDG